MSFKNSKTEMPDYGEVVGDPKFVFRAKYPWEQWTDGQAWRLTKEKHFPGGTPETLSISAYARARKMRGQGTNVQAKCHIEDDDHIVIQFIYPDKKPKVKKPRSKKGAAKKVVKDLAKKFRERRQFTAQH